MRTAIIIKKPEDFDWSKVPVLPIDNRENPTSGNVTAAAQICYDEEALYLRLSAVEKHIRAEHTGPLGMPYEDSCLEFFFSPMAGDMRYFNIEFNPNACVYLGIGSCLQDLVRLIPNSGDVLCPQVERTVDGWAITYQVPVSFVQRFFPDFRLESGKEIRANFYKCGALTVFLHNLSWNKLTEGKRGFHRPSDFGMLVLE